MTNHTIATQEVDHYVQGLLVHRELTPAARAAQAAAAIHVHVMQEAGLPLTTPLPIPQGVGLAHVEGTAATAAKHLDDFYGFALETALACGELFPEYHGVDLSEPVKNPTREDMHREVREVSYIKNADLVGLSLIPEDQALHPDWKIESVDGKTLVEESIEEKKFNRWWKRGES